MTTPFIISQGGIGDAFLSLAASYRHGKCRIVHAAAGIGVHDLIARIFALFGIPEFDVIPRQFTIEEYCVLRYSRNCISTTYLPDNLEFGDWCHFGKYKSRVTTELPVQELFGKAPNPRQTKRVVVIAPAGSNVPRTIVAPWGDVTKERLLTKPEYDGIVAKCLEDCTVYVVGGPKDQKEYGMPSHPNFFWATFDEMSCGEGGIRKTEMKDLFAVINGADLVVSADTWVKTYSCMAKVPTLVSRTRYDGQYFDFRDVQDWGENIFLNQDIWDLEIVKAEDLVKTALIKHALKLDDGARRTRYL